MSIDNVQGNIFLRRALSRKWHIVLWFTILGLLLGGASYFFSPQSYTSTATVFLNQLVGNPFSPTTPTSRTEQLAALTTESGVVLTDDVIEGAIVSSGLTDVSPQAFRQSTSATIPSNSQVMDISFSSSSPEQAQSGAQALTESFLRFRTERAQQVVESQGALLESREQSLSALLDSANEAYDAAQKSNANQAALIDLDQQVRLYAEELASVKVERTTNANSSVDPGTVIGPANEPGAPDGINGLMMASVILVLGLFTGLFAALVAEHADSRIRDAMDLQRYGAPRALGDLSGPMARGQQKTAALDRYLSLVPMLDKLLTKKPGSLALIGRQSSEEIHAIAIGVSIAFALSGKRVCIVSTAAVSQTHSSRPGLSDVLARQCSLTESLQVTDYGHGSVAVLPMGTREESLAVLAQPVVVTELTHELQASYDRVIYVLCENDSALAATVAASADLSLPSIPTGRERAREVLATCEYLTERGAHIPGCLLYSVPWVLASEKELVEAFESRSQLRTHERTTNAS